MSDISKTVHQMVLARYVLFLLKTPFLLPIISFVLGLIFFGGSHWNKETSNLFLDFSITFFIITIISLFISIFQIIIRKKQKVKFENSILTSGIDQVYDLSSNEFEIWIARLIELDGYKARVTTINREHGVNIIASKNNIKIVIHVNKSAEPLGIRTVKQIIAGREYYGAVQGWIMSTAPSFTTEAINQADAKRIKLFNYNDLSTYLSKIQDNHKQEK